MKRILVLASGLALLAMNLYAQDFKLNDSGYFNYKGVDAMLFSDYYPEGHQGGVSIIMHGKRVVTNGDIRFDETPGQWQPVPRKLKTETVNGALVTTLAYPDSSHHATGSNPLYYPDVQLVYTITLAPRGKGFEITVDLDRPIPEEFIGKAGFNLEIFPGWVFGKPYLMDDGSGIYPQQANGPVLQTESYTKHLGDFHKSGQPKADFDYITRMPGFNPLEADEIVAEPYAQGQRFVSRPDAPYTRLTVVSETAPLKLYDGRMNHSNGWFVLRSEIPAGAVKGAVKWYIEPNVVDDWTYKPVVQVSQVGYLPAQQKIAVIELDTRDKVLNHAELYRYTPQGEQLVKTLPVKQWDGKFLRYNYARADFSDITESGAYVMRYGDSSSPVFRIDSDVFDRGVWQPVIEYFLPVQMCHMRVSDKYRVWHDACHLDDAIMASPGSYFDGYVQKEGVDCKLQPGEHAQGLDMGGWHDAGDDDVRIESQIDECFVLTKIWEEFQPQIDVTAIDFHKHTTEIHQPDGKNDILQQIEAGALTSVNGYLALGHSYMGIICTNLRQYVLLGDPAAMTDNIPGTDDDRRVFVDPDEDLFAAINFAGTARSLYGYNDTLANHCLHIAREVFDELPIRNSELLNKVNLAAELWQTTGEEKYSDFVIRNWNVVLGAVARSAVHTAVFAKHLEGNRKYKKQYNQYIEALRTYNARLKSQISQTPYGVPYRPDIWGAGWDIQAFGYRHYFLVKHFPEIFDIDPIVNSMNFILGTHPGSNQQSFASGIGSESVTVGYGFNRADWSYIPGGVVSGTALIRPDFPELLVWPFLWQQTEYVLGGGSTHYMFLVLATQKFLK